MNELLTNIMRKRQYKCSEKVVQLGRHKSVKAQKALWMGGDWR